MQIGTSRQLRAPEGLASEVFEVGRSLRSCREELYLIAHPGLLEAPILEKVEP